MCNKLRPLIIILLASLMTACAGSRQFIPIASSHILSPHAKICVLRKFSFFGAANGADVKEGNDLIASVGPGGYIFWETEPGKIRVKVQPAGVSMVRIGNYIDINAQAGKTYFIYAEDAFGVFNLRLLSSKEGNELLKKHDAPKFIVR